MLATMRWSRIRIALFCSLGVTTASADVPADARPAQVQQRVIALVNEARAGGRTCGNERFAPTTPLVVSDQLFEAASGHARDMARRGYFDHRSRDGSEPKARVLRTGYRPGLTGENIAFGPETAEEVVAGWLASPGHCANMMDPRFRDTGIAVASGSQRGQLYWVQVLAAPLNRTGAGG